MLPVTTEVLGVSQEVSSVVDGMNYLPFLNHKETTIDIAIKNHNRYREEVIKKEGSTTPSETKN